VKLLSILSVTLPVQLVVVCRNVLIHLSAEPLSTLEVLDKLVELKGSSHL
jgi:hypothetical protein